MLINTKDHDQKTDTRPDHKPRADQKLYLHKILQTPLPHIEIYQQDLSSIPNSQIKLIHLLFTSFLDRSPIKVAKTKVLHAFFQSQ